MHDIIDGQKVFGLTHDAASRDVQRGKPVLIHGVGSVVRMETTLPLHPGVLIAKGMAEIAPRNTK
jgi:hypothetical protein